MELQFLGGSFSINCISSLVLVLEFLVAGSVPQILDMDVNLSTIITNF